MRHLPYLKVVSLVLSIMLGVSAQAGTDSGRILRIDPKTGTLTLTKGRPYVTYRFRVSMEVSLNGQPAKISQLVPGLQVTIESNEPGIASRITANGALEVVSPRTSVKPVSVGLVDLNSATAAELEDLPGIGPVLVDAIIKARPFSSVQDLSRVKGIGAKTIEKLRPFVKVN